MKTPTTKSNAAAGGRSLQCLVSLFEREAESARDRIAIYHKHGHEWQRQYTEGQLDAFTAAVRWIRKEQNTKCSHGAAPLADTAGPALSEDKK